MLLVVVFFWAGITGCLPSSSNVVNGHISNSENTATLSKRDSGAMSKGSTLVSVRPNGVPDNDTHGQIELGLIGDKGVEMKWIGPRNLSLTCATCTRQDITFEVVKSGDIVITYGDNLSIH